MVAPSGGNVNLPCTFTKNQNDMVTLILFYRNASHVGQVGAPLYTLDARTSNEPKSSEINSKIVNKNSKDQQSRPIDENDHQKLIRQTTISDRETFFIINNDEKAIINYRNQAIRRFKRSSVYSLSVFENKNQSSKNSNEEKLITSIGNVSMVNGISSLMHLLAIKGHFNQSRLSQTKNDKINDENQIKFSKKQINQLESNSNQTKSINFVKKTSVKKTNQTSVDFDSHRMRLLDIDDKSIFYELEQQNDESNSPTDQSNHLFDHKIMKATSESRSQTINDDQTINQLENEPQHFVAPHLANRSVNYLICDLNSNENSFSFFVHFRIRLSWPPSQLRQHHPFNSFIERSFSSTNNDTNSTTNTLTTSKKLESRSQTNQIKNDPILYFNALLNIKNATEEDAGEYLCKF